MFVIRLSATNLLITLVSWATGMILIRSTEIHLPIDNMLTTFGICWIFLNWLEFKHPIK